MSKLHHPEYPALEKSCQKGMINSSPSTSMCNGPNVYISKWSYIMGKIEIYLSFLTSECELFSKENPYSPDLAAMLICIKVCAGLAAASRVRRM
jgi:hypothetical protein